MTEVALLQRRKMSLHELCMAYEVRLRLVSLSQNLTSMLILVL